MVMSAGTVRKSGDVVSSTVINCTACELLLASSVAVNVRVMV